MLALEGSMFWARDWPWLDEGAKRPGGFRSLGHHAGRKGLGLVEVRSVCGQNGVDSDDSHAHAFMSEVDRD